jgi:diguanylate cyclase (GGDEF)-like protein
MSRDATRLSLALAADLARVHRIAATRGEVAPVGAAFLRLLGRHAGLPFGCLVVREEPTETLVVLGGDLPRAAGTVRLHVDDARDLAGLLASSSRQRWAPDILPVGLRGRGGGGVALALVRGTPGRPRLLVRDRDLACAQSPVTAAILSHLASALSSAEVYRRALDLSFRDELTGVYNYRFLMEALDREAKRAQRFDHVFSVVMLDLDNLKEFNDRHGHLKGSEVLRVVGRTIPTCLRKVDLAAKYGGDEFVIILPRTDKPGALKVCERIRRRVSGHRRGGPRGPRITVSLGVASFPADGRTPRVLLRKADRALYRAKAGGRNSVST